MMRSFEARGDCAVTDEPFYAAYLHRTGLNHPLREEVLASQSRDPHEVINLVLGPVPDRKPIWYQKHMTLHMLPEFDRGWLARVSNAFLIREPRAVLASYAAKRADVTLADLGFVQQQELFDAVPWKDGRPPPVVDAADILARPAEILGQLCAALGIEFTPKMLEWRAGLRPTDGVWAPAWYQSVERSTGFGAAPTTATPELSPALERLAEQAEPYYDALWRHRLG
jgi:hypothetical protein